MTSAFPAPFPAWLDAHLVTDAAFGAAYDALTPQERACIKTGIARMAAVEGGGHPVTDDSSRALRQGFSLHARTRPADWAVVMWDAAYTGPSRILAALLPAMLAGVPEILACCVVAEGENVPAPVLAALELAGQELAAALTPDDARALAAHCCGTGPAAGTVACPATCPPAYTTGRLVLLGAHPVFSDAARTAAEGNIPCYRMAARTRIGIAASSFAEPVLNDHLRFAHPDASLVSFEGDAAEGGFAAVFCGREHVPAYIGASPLVLTPGNECYWRWHGLDAAFYRESSLAVCDTGTGNDPD